MKYNHFVITIVIGTFLLSSCNHNDEVNSPTTGIALGGGGAKAAAEIGVLEELEQLGVKIDYIAGTSMGAVVGGLYAAGYSGKELREMWLNEGWLQLFDKNEVFKFGNNNRSFFGVINGDEFEYQLRNALKAKECSTFADLRIPFVCVSTLIIDDTRIEERYLGLDEKDKDLDLARAIRASMTHPLGYSPITLDGMRLVDGGMVNNLPVDVVDSMGAERVIAVDLDMNNYNVHHDSEMIRLLPSINDRVSNAVEHTKTEWLFDWLSRRPDIDKCITNRRHPGMIYIRPRLDKYDILSFSIKDAETMMSFGKAWAKKERRKLKMNN